jgi:hypothetical protein
MMSRTGGGASSQAARAGNARNVTQHASNAANANRRQVVASPRHGRRLVRTSSSAVARFNMALPAKILPGSGGAIAAAGCASPTAEEVQGNVPERRMRGQA